MSNKIKKIKIFAKPIKENLFAKKILKYIEQKSDKEFLQNSFELKDGFYTLIPLTDTKEDKAKHKRLSKLAKDIKANKALPVNFIPLAGISIFVGAAFVFFTIIMNPLLERLIENALENVFEARVEINNFNLNILRFRISLNSITIADRDAPMTNLFDMRRTEIRFLPQAVLRGKIYIEEIRADSIQFGTPRKYSGALPGKSKTDVPIAPKPPAPPLVDLQQFNPTDLINAQYDNLKTPKLYNELSVFYSTAVEKWSGQTEQSKQQIQDLQIAAEPFIKFDLNKLNMKDPAAIQSVLKMIEDGKKLSDTAISTAEQVNIITKGVTDDLNTANNLVKSATASIQDDFDFLKSFLDLSGGPYQDIFNSAIQQILTGTAKKYIAYGKRALDTMEKLKTYQKEAEAAKPKKTVFKGRDVYFPTRAYPKFYLGIFASDFILNEWKSAFDLRDVSSDPDITGLPTTLKINIEELGGAKKNFAFNGKADFRNSITELYDAEVTGINIPFSLEKDLSGIQELGIGGFKGDLGFSVRSNGNKAGGMGFAGNLGVVQPSLLDPSGTLADSINEAIQEAGIVEIGFDWQHIAANNDNFTLNSNLQDLILASLKKAGEKYLKKAQEELEKALRAYIADFLKDKNITGEQLDKIMLLAKGDSSSINTLQDMMQTKLKEMQTKSAMGFDDKLGGIGIPSGINANGTQNNNDKQKSEADAKREAEDAAKNAMKNVLGGKLKF